MNSGVEHASSVVIHEDGSFTLGSGADLINSGTVDVSAGTSDSNAGQIVALGENVTNSGDLLAVSQSGQADDIEVHASDTSLLTEQSQTSAQAQVSGKGGTVKVLGDKVDLFDEAKVDVSGGVTYTASRARC